MKKRILKILSFSFVMTLILSISAFSAAAKDKLPLLSDYSSSDEFLEDFYSYVSEQMGVDVLEVFESVESEHDIAVFGTYCCTPDYKLKTVTEVVHSNASNGERCSYYTFKYTECVNCGAIWERSLSQSRDHIHGVN